MRRLRTAILVSVVAAAVALPQTPLLAARKVVRATSENRWSPAHVFVDKGTRVVWKNPTSRLHTVKSSNAGKNWSMSKKKLKAEGGRASHVFRKRGAFHFLCTRHDNMTGIIHVD